MIDKFIKKFTDRTIEYDKVGKEYYYIPKQLKKINLPFKETFRGLYLGRDENKFLPSLALLNILAKLTDELIVVKDIGEIDFIYGKDLRERHIESIKGTIKPGFMKIVVNKHTECLGLGKISDIEPVKVKNILDIGDYLRREKD
jgi:ribosome biogenesis protein Nip4